MGMPAVAALIRATRESRNIKRREFAASLGISETSVYRIEEKGQDPSPELLANIIDALGLNWEAVRSLLLNPHATEQDGIQAAQTMRRQLGARHQEALERLNDDELDALIEFLQRVQGSR